MGDPKKPRTRLRPRQDALRDLYLHSGNQCAFPGCTGPILLADGTLNGEIAHIYGVREGAARGRHSLSNEELRDVSNLVFLCLKHHAVVDNKSNEAKYPVTRMQKMKAEHEAKFREAVAGLERAEDLSVEDRARLKKPVNLRALSGEDLDEEEFACVLEDASVFIKAIRDQPPAVRDVIAAIVDHGQSYRHGRVVVSAVKLEGVLNLDVNEIARRVNHLERAGLLDVNTDEGHTEFVLRDPTKNIDHFAELKRLGGERGGGRAIRDLDFTIFDE
ncbi:hypothetical protein [Brachybacterium hainanense]|uniref:HNH endonuclease n=1 Tax=Brachybacterium hainanense TaxID=1541174 RepID=A0ABV6RC31_9MICO